MFFLAGRVFSDSLVCQVNVLAGQIREDKRSASVTFNQAKMIIRFIKRETLLR
ncbi:hypothetical protein Xentx_02305 [Xenorhabdus thuongxuanensis]|uniref:Uncharacterized protein n=1 Tax=Xenorhabdus thuongxuanensis TaxID=1873484 RepID=A0A1Q5U0J3_9GAMM|nr:hypothetical protein Xentx_02305 [Xenorhabdus thuongxuanensis]